MDTNQIRKEARLNNIVVGGLLASGAIAFGVSCYGRQVDLIEYCFKPNNSPQFCTPDKRYLMPVDEFSRILNDPLTNEDRIIAEKATRLRILPASNPYKWLWGMLSVGFIGTAYGLSKARERKLIEYLPQYRESVKQSWVLNKLSNWQQERRVMLNAYNDDRKRQYAADLDFQLWQFGADRAARSKQLSMLTPEEIAVFHEQARLRAVQEAQSRIHEATGQPQAQLPGQSLDEVTDPSDKVSPASEPQVLTPEVIDQNDGALDPMQSGLESILSAYRWLNEFISNTSLIIGSQGSGKSWLVRLLALLKKLKGYKVIVFDPNSNRIEWMGVEFYGSYEDIQNQMKEYVDEIQNRYDGFRESTMTEEAWRKKLWADGKALSIICEEYSTYNDFIEDKALIKKFVKSASTLSRKQEAPVVFVSHNLSKECLGNIEGLFDIFKRMQRLTLDTKTHPTTGQPVSAGTGTVKAVDSDEFRVIKTPHLKDKIRDFRTEVDRLQDTRSFLEKQFQHPEMDETPSIKPNLTEKHKALMEYLKANGARTIKQIADSRRWGLPETRKLVKDLIQHELVEMDGDTYRLINN
jgi:energy-coupling factor transporter ATP-binding protein EcfA2